MKALILGGSENIAYATTKDLTEIDTEEVVGVTIASRNYEKMKKAANQFQSKELTPLFIDISKQAKEVAKADLEVDVNQKAWL